MNRTRELCARLGIRLPILQAPMAGAQDERLAIAVAAAGALGSLPCAMLAPEAIAEQVDSLRRSGAPVHLNFFCHSAPAPDGEREARWRALLEPYYRELGIAGATPAAGARTPF